MLYISKVNWARMEILWRTTLYGWNLVSIYLRQFGNETVKAKSEMKEGDLSKKNSDELSQASHISMACFMICKLLSKIKKNSSMLQNPFHKSYIGLIIMKQTRSVSLV